MGWSDKDREQKNVGEKRRAWEWAGKEYGEKSLRGMVGKKQMGF